MLIIPRVFDEKPPLAVFWSKVGPVGNLRDFVPNHFVPLVSRNMIYLSGKVSVHSPIESYFKKFQITVNIPFNYVYDCLPQTNP